ncbi:ABC transporter permease [Planctomyces sp. SH-PL62]|uniref:ABC transporter permease n=1 Tax=Planctomyces sp. SH-PL62 TaxID=1636152 RepID=UPI00078ED88B|nr:ABC transporter permease [Planctomyces sp. SH-PL62]AMV36663.1 Macrolide export ATP-binding/permease protein MacB [Planctomyces sp. SH-PL62]
MMWSFAWMNLVTRPSRTALAVLGLTIPVLAFLALFSLSGGIRHLMGDTLAGMDNLMVMSANAPAPVFSDLPPGTGDVLRQISGVRAIAAEVWKLAPPIDGQGGGGLAGAALRAMTKPQDQGLGGISLTTIQGQDIPAHARLKNVTIRQSLLPASKGGGRMLDESDVGRPNILISSRIAREHPDADGSARKVGQTMRIGGQDFTIVGLFNTGSLLIDSTIVMDIHTARKLLNLGPDVVSTYNVELEETTERDALAERIAQAAPGLRVQRISQFNISVGAIMGRLDLLLLLAVALAVLVGGVGIANTMLMSTSERYVEFGVMRTNGWTRRNVLALVTAESSLLGLLSGLLGTGLATLGVLAVNRFLDGFTLEMSPRLITVGLAGALAIATLSGLYPAWRASRMTPMDAIRRSDA